MKKQDVFIPGTLGEIQRFAEELTRNPEMQDTLEKLTATAYAHAQLIQMQAAKNREMPTWMRWWVNILTLMFQTFVTGTVVLGLVWCCTWVLSSIVHMMR